MVLKPTYSVLGLIKCYYIKYNLQASVRYVKCHEHLLFNCISQFGVDHHFIAGTAT